VAKVLDFVAPKDLEEIQIACCSDWHWGSPQCKQSAVRKFVGRILDEKMYWIGVGDLCENALAGTPGDIYAQTLGPDAQIREVVQLLEPIKDYCLGMIAGNHGRRTVRAAGIDPDNLIADLLGVSYHGYTMAGRVAVGNAHYIIVAHHIAGGGRTIGGKANALARLAETWPIADIYIGGHTHLSVEFDTRVKVVNTSGGKIKHRWHTRHFCGTGSTLDYDGSYAEAAMMAPAAMAQAVMTLGNRVHLGDGHYRKPYKREALEL